MTKLYYVGGLTPPTARVNRRGQPIPEGIQVLGRRVLIPPVGDSIEVPPQVAKFILGRYEPDPNGFVPFVTSEIVAKRMMMVAKNEAKVIDGQTFTKDELKAMLSEMEAEAVAEAEVEKAKAKPTRRASKKSESNQEGD